MSEHWAILLPVLLGFVLAEFTEISPWLAKKLLRFMASKFPGNAGELRLMEWEAQLPERPGKFLKLCWALELLRGLPKMLLMEYELPFYRLLAIKLFLNVVFYRVSLKSTATIIKENPNFIPGQLFKDITLGKPFNNLVIASLLIKMLQKFFQWDSEHPKSEVDYDNFLSLIKSSSAKTGLSEYSVEATAEAVTVMALTVASIVTIKHKK